MQVGLPRGPYLKQPIASAMEGGDDGRVDVAAIETLEGKGQKGGEVTYPDRSY